MATNNPKLRNRKEQMDELIKCVDNPSYFIKTYLYIQHPVRGRLPFKLYEFQEDCITDFLEYKYNVIVKSRQLGISTLTAAYCLWLALFHRDQNIIIMATKLEVGKLLIRKIRTTYKMLPEWMTELLQITELEGDSVKYMSLANGSKITAIPTSVNSMRGEAASLVCIDESAYIEGFSDLWEGIFPCLSTGGRAIVFSTPNGKGSKFHEIYTEAIENNDWVDGKAGFHGTTTGTNNFHPIKLPWTVHPERDDNWFEEQSKSMDQKAIAQELMCDFSGSGQTYFNQVQIDDVKLNAVSPFIMMGPTPGSTDLWVWKTPTPGHKYILSSDVARGDSEDYSTFHVIDTNENEIAAEYMGKIQTDAFGLYLIETATRYNNAIIIQEKNTFGTAVSNVLKAAKYPNVWYEPEIQEKLMYLSQAEKDKLICGFTTTSKNREPMLQNMEEVIRNKRLRIYSTRFVEEMENFIWTGRRGQALKKKHDDLIMGLGIGLQIFTPTGNGFKARTTDNSIPWHQAFLNGLSKTNKLMSTTQGSYGSPIQNYNNTGMSVGQNTPFGPIKQNIETFNGKKLPPGVKRENIEIDQIIRSEFDWLFK